MYKICSTCDAQNELNELMCKECFQRKFTYPSEINTTTVNKSYEESPHLTTLDQEKEVLKLKRNNEFLLEIKHNDVIGRESLLNEYIKDNLKISRFHCRFIFENNSWFIKDENSTNGTFINDIQLKENEKKLIQNNDKLKISLGYSIDIIIE